MAFELTGKRVWVAGQHGMVGSALVRRLRREPCELLDADRTALDFRRQTEVEDWMRFGASPRNHRCGRTRRRSAGE